MPKKANKSAWRVFGGVVGLLLWTWVAVIASQVVVGYAFVAFFGTASLDSPVTTAILSALSYILAMILVLFVPYKVLVAWRKTHGGKPPKPVNRTGLGLRGLPTWTDIGLAPVGFMVFLVLAAALTTVFNHFSWFDASEAQDVGFNFLVSGFDRMVAFLTLVVVAPVAEEVIFRGWLYGKLRSKTTEAVTDVVSIIISSLLVSVLFGIVHMQWNVGVNVFALSLVLCALREITGTIYAGILLHMLKNGVAFYLLYMVGI